MVKAGVTCRTSSKQPLGAYLAHPAQAAGRTQAAAMAVTWVSPAPQALLTPGPITHLVVQTAARRVDQENPHARPPLLQVAPHPRYRAAGACPADKRVHTAARLLPNLLACWAGGRRRGSVCNSLGQAASGAAVGWSAAGARQQAGCYNCGRCAPAAATPASPPPRLCAHPSSGAPRSWPPFQIGPQTPRLAAPPRAAAPH